MEYKGVNYHRIFLGFLADQLSFFSRINSLFAGDAHPSAKHFDKRSLKQAHLLSFRDLILLRKCQKCLVLYWEHFCSSYFLSACFDAPL